MAPRDEDKPAEGCTTTGAVGVVDGTNGADAIDVTYVDPQGDVIDGGDASLPGQAPNDDIVDARAGDDSIESGDGNDTVYGGSGSDVIDGGDGNDHILADEAHPDGNSGAVREVFKWNEAPDPQDGGPVDGGDDLSWGFSQMTGSVEVSFVTARQDPGHTAQYTSDPNNLDGVDTGGMTPNPNSGLESVTSADGSQSFHKLEFSDPVTNVEFQVTDIDKADQVQIQAWDPDGNAIPVTLTGGGNVVVQDVDYVAGGDTAVSAGGSSDAADGDHALLVSIPGPVGSIKIRHMQDGDMPSDVQISDVYFDGLTTCDDGPDGNDTVDGGDGDDTFEGGGGNDHLMGGDGDDHILGGDGDDAIQGGDGSDVVRGGDGDDVIDTSGGTPLPDRGVPAYDGNPAVPADADPTDDRDTVIGGDGNDRIITGDDDDMIDAGDGDDSIDGGLDDDLIMGGAGDDEIIGGEGADTIDGGDGDDVIHGGLHPSLPDALNILDDGADGRPVDPDPFNGVDVIHGGAGNDTIYGQDDADQLYGDDGNDFIDGGIDDDEIHGGAGDDRLLGGHGADVIDGGDDADIIGTGVGDTVRGGEGGNDNDVLIVDGLATVDYDDTDPTGESGTITYYNDDLTVAGTSTFSEIEHVLSVGTPDNGSTTEGVGPGGPGTAIFDGIVEGTAGDDVIDVPYLGDPDGDRVDSDDAILPLQDEKDVILAGGGNDTVRGRDDDDVIFGGTGDDDIRGDDGNDALSGDAGDDVLRGGAGSDMVSGGAGNDLIFGGNDVAGDGPDLLAGGADNDTFVNVGPGDVIYGGEDADGQDIDTIRTNGLAEAANPGGSIVVDYDPTNGENGTIRYFDAGGTETGQTQFFGIERVVPCFTPGSLIATPEGERLVEDLKVGDRVITRDNGIQKIRWMGTRTLSAQELKIAPNLKPVMIRRGALGSGLPERDMVVSPNHRILVANDRTSYYFDDSEVLVAAKFLAGLEGVRSFTPGRVSYMHFMFDQHEVVLADGAWSESFQPGDMTLDSMGDDQRQEIFDLFPELSTTDGIDAYSAARRSLKRFEAELLVQ